MKFILAFMNPPHVMLPGGSANLLILVRWIHLIGGITWVGLLYFFVLVNTPVLQEIEPTVRPRVVVTLMPRALWWFRWSAVVTVLAGIWYWMTIVTADAHNAQTGGGHAIGTFFMIWTAAFIVEMALLMGPMDALRFGPVLGIITGIVVVAASYLYLSLNSHGWESNRLLAIGIGGGLGWFMLLNVWGLIWRIQKKIIRWTNESISTGKPMPPEAAKLARLGMLASRINFVLTFPMLFFMAAASHWPVFGQ